MNSQNDDIIIHRKGGATNNLGTLNSQSTGRTVGSKKKNDINPLDKFAKQYERHIKILSIILLIFCVLTFIALISYTPKDEASTNVSIGDFIGLIKGRPDVTQKAETTSNWLGLAGAVISNVLYNNSIGYVVVFLPIFIGLCAYDLYKRCKVSEMLLRRTVIYLIFGVFFAGLMGTLSKVNFLPQISKEWSGIVGQFLASVMSGVLGTIGSFIIYLSALAFTVYLGTNLRYKNIKDLIDDKIKPDSKIRSGINSLLTKMRIIKPKQDINIDNPINNPAPVEEAAVVPVFEQIDNDEPEQDEPARIIRSNMDYSDESYNKPNPLDGFDPNVDDTRVFVGIRRPEGMAQVEVNSYQVDEVVQKIDESHQNNINSISNVNTEDQQINDSLNNNPTPNVRSDFDKQSSAQTIDSQINDNDAEVPGIDYHESNSDITDIEENNDNLHVNYFDDNENLNVQDTSDSDTFSNGEIEESVPNKKIESELFNNEINALKNAAYSASVISGTASVAHGVGAVSAGAGALAAAGVVAEVAEVKPEKKALNVFVNDDDESTSSDSRVNPLSTSVLEQNIDYKPPIIELLNNEETQSEVNEEELKMNARILQEKLETFKIFIENLTVTPGPVVTQYEFVPAAGIKISRIENLADDIAMALKARGIRIIAPVPGKGTVGIEIPNLKPATVRFSSVIKSKKFHDNTMKLPMALGKTISGEVFIADLAKMPHLLVAGATGSGKSVGINTIIASLVYKMHPRDLKFVIVDPKKVELRQYERLLNHYLAVSPDIDDCIVTDPQDAIIVLKALCAEMDKRYEILASVGQRNIFDYNQKVKEGKFTDDKEFIHKPMPYIVAIVDELADLMLTAGKEVETPLIRLAQLARAVGIHCVVATQRPSVDVITGIIKANFPARISYLVASKIDSRTILDGMGAEKLLGNGDMLFLVGGAAKPLRIQNAFISTDEVENICDWVGQQKGFSEPYYLPSLNEKASQSGDDYGKEDRDPLFEEAARLIIRHQQGSVSLIQRRLKVGYARAGRIVDELERAGVVGPFDGSKARQVFMDSESELEAIL